MKLRKLASIFVLGALLMTGCQAGGTTGKSEDVAKEKTVVAATVSGSQVLDKLDANVVGIPTTQLEMPEKFKGLPEVGQSMNPDLEVVASLNPDVFVMDNAFKDSVEKSLKEYDFNTFFLKTNTYTDYIKSIEELGKTIDKEEEATTLINELKNIEKEVKSKKGDKAPTVAIIFGSGENFMLATETSYLGDLVKTVGGKNIASKLDKNVENGYVQLSLEYILEQNPDYILRFAHGNLEETKKSFDKAFDKNPAYQELNAVKNNKVVDLDSNVFNVSANLKVKEAIQTLGDILYGE
ncbi:MAG: ABC transporter substrate-binding protein [Terrisporobacter sp.]|jgi:iron complex transport system substrate-binding protein|uniref:ABC transporter substrate-binding protein n=1 Tax=Terrisporobacter sp. TaxID=1965305 RepID=UPI0025DE1959|nr:ABC transporter substrate-binding protein [uncultured Terrisporobacter sp.]